MRSFFISLSILSSILGLFFIYRGGIHPKLYQKELSKSNATAVRVTQVYTEATYRVVIGIGILTFGILSTFLGFLISTDAVKKYSSLLIGKFRKNTSDTPNAATTNNEEHES